MRFGANVSPPDIAKHAAPAASVVLRPGDQALLLAALSTRPAAQAVDTRHWQGVVAMTRQPEQVVASTTAEWRSLWSRVGMAAPDVFEPGRMNAVGIFLGRRASEGYSVNILSTSRRRDRIVVVFEERMPAEIMMAQRASPAPRDRIAGARPGLRRARRASFAPPGARRVPGAGRLRPPGPSDSRRRRGPSS